MKYIALLDQQHLENNLFMKSFAHAVSRQKNVQSIILHGDSPYTDRLIQTGMMREDAQIRSTKELNIRIITILADYGVSAIGLNPYQRNAITSNGYDLTIDTPFLQSLPSSTVLILSNLIGDRNQTKPIVYPVVTMVEKLKDALDIDEVFVFSSDEKEEILNTKTSTASIKWQNLEEIYKNNFIPREIVNSPISFRMVTTKGFSQVPDLSYSTEIIYKGS